MLATTKMNIGNALSLGGKHAQALLMYADAKPVLETELGTDHPTTIALKRNMNAVRSIFNAKPVRRRVTRERG